MLLAVWPGIAGAGLTALLIYMSLRGATVARRSGSRDDPIAG